MTDGRRIISISIGEWHWREAYEQDEDDGGGHGGHDDAGDVAVVAGGDVAYPMLLVRCGGRHGRNGRRFRSVGRFHFPVCLYQINSIKSNC